MRKACVSVCLALLLALMLSACGAAGETAETEPAGKTVDVDLSQLSSTMAYSEVYNMVTAPESYVGKTVRMTGTLDIYEDAAQTYFACIISDATACCAQGLEFVPKEGYNYPEDFPPVGGTLTVEGTFALVKEGEYLYIQLLNADMTY